jgi:elongation factor Ts
MAITAADIAKLRHITGAGMMDCKQALNESEGDFDLAIESLRKRGQKISAKRADRLATEGAVIAITNENATKGAVIELNCETDFVGKNVDFLKFANQIAQVALDKEPSDIDELLTLNIESQKISDILDGFVAKIGEKIEISNCKLIKGEFIAPYIHLGNKIGVLVSFNKPKTNIIHELGKDLAMQIAAMNPIAVERNRISPEIVQKELEIAKEQSINEGKPAELAEKIAQGRLNKFYKESALLEQEFVKDPSKTIQEVVKGIDKDLNVIDFVRVAIGQ